MTKRTGKQIFTSIAIGIIAVTACLFGFNIPTKSTSYALPNYIPFVAGTTNNLLAQEYKSESIGKSYTYATSGYFVAPDQFVTDSNDATDDNVLITNYDSGSYVMLNNYLAQNTLLNTSDINQNIETMYLGIGNPVGLGNAGNEWNIVISNLNVQAWLTNDYVHNTYNSDSSDVTNYVFYDGAKGVRIAINSPSHKSLNINDSNTKENYYWYNYFDLGKVDALLDPNGNTTEQIHEVEGKYTIEISGQVDIYNSSRKTWDVQNFTHSYSFYLLDENSYLDYPTLNSFTDNDAEDDTYSQLEKYIATGSPTTYYYNFQQKNYPALVYNATKYNVEYSTSYSDNYYEYTTEFEMINDDTPHGRVTTKLGATEVDVVDIYLNSDENKINYYRDGQQFAYITIDANGVFKLYNFGNDQRQNGKIIKYGAKGTPANYYYFLEFNDLGLYTFSYKYVISENDSTYNIIDSEIATFTLRNLSIDDTQGVDLLQNATYENGFYSFGEATLAVITNTDTNFDSSTEGQDELRVFGVKSSFYKDLSSQSSKTAFEDSANAIYSDQTVNISSDIDLTNTTYTNIPLTNLQPIYFDYLGTYAFDGLEAQSTIYRFIRGRYTRNGNEITVTPTVTITKPSGEEQIVSSFEESTYIKDQSIDTDGFYVIVFKYTYDFYNVTAGKTFTQIFAFEINNVAPVLTLYSGSEGSMTEQDSASSYTNNNYISATWREPNYFEGDIYATITHYEYTATGVSNVGTTIYDNVNSIYSKGIDSYINVKDGKSVEGKYVITLHYGLAGSNSRDYIIYIDRSDINYTMYSVNQNETKYSKTNQLNQNISNKLFTLAHGTKPSGAEIYVKYQMIPFNLISDFTATKLGNYSLTNYFINENDSIASSLTTYPYNIGDENMGDSEEGSIPKELVFGTMGNALFVITLTDDAGNQRIVYYVYDTTTPIPVMIDANGNAFEIDNDSNIVNANTTVFFGSHKAIRLSLADEETLINTDAINAISGDNWLGSYIDVINGVNYLLIPLAKDNKQIDINNNEISATPKSSHVIDFTIYKNQSVAVSQSDKYTISNGDTTITYFSGDGKTYLYTITDSLGNMYSSTIWMNLDKAQVLPTLQMVGNDTDWHSITGNFDVNGKAYNANNFKLSWNQAIQTGDLAIGAEISYYYYPFAFNAYLVDGQTTYPTYSGETDDKYGRPVPTYPFARTHASSHTFTQSETTLDGGRFVTLNSVNGLDNGNTSQGMYIIKRQYTGVDETQFSNIEEDDKFIRYYVIYVDRYGVIDLTYNLDGTLDEINSIGDLINIVLGAQTSGYTTTIDARNLISLINNAITLEVDNIFETNKVKVNLNTKSDKWSTADKLNNTTLADYTNSELNNTEIDTAITRNNNIFATVVDLSYQVENNNTSEIINNYVIKGNKIIEPSTVTLVDDKLQNILLNQEHSYTLKIYNYSGITQTDSNTGNIIDNNAYSTQIEFSFKITYERPAGSYNSVYTDEADKIKPLSSLTSDDINGIVTYKSTNEKVLQFKYSDSLVDTKATIDPSYLLVEQRAGAINSNSFWTKIFEINETNADSISSDYFNKVQIATAEDGTALYEYTLTIFDERKANSLADYTRDASYQITLRFVGEDTDYLRSTGGNYRYNTYQIYVDRVNPENNLATLISNDKVYNGEDLDKYFFAVNNGINPTIFDGTDANDSAEIYYRKLGTNYPTNYKKSLVNGETEPIGNPIFNIYDNRYNRLVYETDGKYSFEGFNNGYYEIIERDQAGNCTVYGVFVSNNDETHIQATSSTFENGEKIEKSTTIYAGGLNPITGKEISINGFDLRKLSYQVPESSDIYLLDQTIKVTISAKTNLESEFEVLTTLSNSITDIDEWFDEVCTTFNDLTAQNIGVVYYKLEFTNRFGENYIVLINLPGSELELVISDNDGQQVKVTVPAKLGNINIDKFSAYIYQDSKWVLLAQDVNKSINISDTNRDNAETYIFGTGNYKFSITDNYGRTKEYYTFVGNTNSGDYTFDFGDMFKEIDNVIYTSSNVTLNIDKTLWNVTVSGGKYSEITSQVTKRTNYTFTTNDSPTAEFVVTLRWASAGNDSVGTTFNFVIDTNTPAATFTDVNGKILAVKENNNNYTRDFYITFTSGKYGVKATLKQGSTSKSISSGHLINTAGDYTLTLINGIGATETYKFSRSTNNFSFYSILVDGKELPFSDYITTEEGRSVHHYFVLSNYFEDNLTQLVIDGNDGYQSDIMIDDGSIRKYAIYKDNTNIICYVQINYIDKKTSFANARIRLGSLGSDVTITQPTYTTTMDQVTLTVDNFHNTNGNVITTNIYYNNELVNTLVGKNLIGNQSFTMTRAGLYSFEMFDIAGNVQYFSATSTRLNIYLINDVVYTINDETPISNQIFNDSVSLKIITYIGANLYEDEVTLSVTRNGQEIDAKLEKGVYTFDQSGYYTITMSTNVNNGSSIEGILTTYNFSIIKPDSANLSFSIPSSYNFTLRRIVLNNADVTNEFTDNSQLWLSVGESGSGLYTITMSYYLPELQAERYFEFKIWINEEVPTIVPVDYTYGTKTSKDVTLQYSAGLIYQQIGNAKVVLTQDGVIRYQDVISSTSQDKLNYVTIKTTNKATAGTYIMSIYNEQGQLVVSYKIIKTVPLNTAAKIIIIVASILLVAGIVVFIVLRKHTKFR